MSKSRPLRLGTAVYLLLGILPSLLSQTPLRVGYAVLSADQEGGAPVASALFSSTNAAGILVWEAGVLAVEPLSSGRIFVDQQEGTRTAIAMVNPLDEMVSVTLILRDAAGKESDRMDQDFGPRQHRSLFADELFSGLSDFSGSLTFQTTDSSHQLAAGTLRENTNLSGEAIFATLPVVDLQAPAGTDPLILPQVGAGQGLSTLIILINASQERVTGTIKLIDGEGAPLEMELDGTTGTEFGYDLEAHGTFRGEITHLEGTAVGYAVVELEEGIRTPSGSAIFQFRAGEAVVSEAGVAGIQPTSQARIFVDQEDTRTGVAIANFQNPETLVTFELLEVSGDTRQTKTETLPAGGHLSVFVDELFSELEEGFKGLMEVRAVEAIAPVTLKLTKNAREEDILTTLPLADLTHPLTGQRLIFPQIAFGDFGTGEFSTRLILINRALETTISGRLDFFQSDGSAMLVPLGIDTASEVEYQVSTGGGTELALGVSSSAVAQILIDPQNPSVKEVVVNEGNTRQLNPVALDGEGEVLEGISFAYLSLNPEVATVDSEGRIEGMLAGFSTLTIAFQEVVATATVTVVKVTSGAEGFEINGVAQDLARRLYLANQGGHTILLAEDLQSMPEVYAGVEQMPGLKDDERLKSLFRNPSYLEFDQARGNLYVSDGANHVIRLVRPGPLGSVHTLAGTGNAGSEDGPLPQASFNNPQGIALDNRGNLWVVDSANHAIRRIDFASGMVETIAGQPGVPGSSDGSGTEAQFDSPSGLAVEEEPLVRQIQRERGGEPPPPVQVIVADTGNNLIRRVTETGEVETIGRDSGSINPGRVHTEPPRLAQEVLTFDSPTGVAIDPFGNIFVAEPLLGQVKTIFPNGEIVAAVQENSFAKPQGLVITESGKVVVVADATRSAQQIEFGKPTITGVSPSRVSSQGSEIVTISGRNFSPDSAVVVAGVTVSNIDVADTQTISFTASPLPSGLAILTVQNRGGLAQTSFTVEAPALTTLPEGHVTTIAGGSTFGGEGSPSTSVAMTAAGVAVDAAGNVFIADSFNNRIRRVDSRTGIITTVAGNGRAGFGGNGDLATAASLNHPTGVLFDPLGNLLIADAYNSRIQVVNSASGAIMTLAGGSDYGVLGEGGAATDAFLGLWEVTGLAVDASRNALYITDVFFNSVRRVDLETNIITTFAGGAEPPDGLGDEGPATGAAFNEPDGLALDLEGNLYIADHSNHRIRKVDIETGIINTVVGDGLEGFSGDGGIATDASLAGPTGIATDSDGNLYLTDNYNNRVRKVDITTKTISTVAGNGAFDFSGDGGPALEAALNGPLAIAVDAAGNVLIADTENKRVRRVDAQTQIITNLAGNGQTSLLNDGSPATLANLEFPESVAVDSEGDIYIADSGHFRVRKVDSGGTISTYAGGGAPPKGSATMVPRRKQPSAASLD